MSPSEAKLAAVLAPELRKEIYTLRRKLMRISVQRDFWRERALRYRKQALGNKT